MNKDLEVTHAARGRGALVGSVLRAVDERPERTAREDHVFKMGSCVVTDTP